MDGINHEKWVVYHCYTMLYPHYSKHVKTFLLKVASRTLYRPNLLAVFKSVHLLRVASPQVASSSFPGFLSGCSFSTSSFSGAWGSKIDFLEGIQHECTCKWTTGDPVGKLMRSYGDKWYGKSVGESLNLRQNSDWSIQGLYCFWGAQPKFDKSSRI